MTKMIICTLLLFVTASSFGQQTNSTQSSINQNYFRKSKNQKTAAWILLGGGAAFVTTGVLIANGSFDNAETGGLIASAGLLSTIASIPLFIASGRNNRKAMKVSTYLELQRHPVQITTVQGFRSSVAFSLKLKL